MVVQIHPNDLRIYMKYIHEFEQLVSVHTPLGEGYILYVRDCGPYENDLFAIVLCSSGELKFMNSNQFTIHCNDTLDIEEKQNG